MSDVDRLVKSTEETGSSQQQLQFDHKQLVQTMERMEKDNAGANTQLRAGLILFSRVLLATISDPPHFRFQDMA